MNKQEYLGQLRKYLKRLSKEEYEQAMEYFTEYFEDAGVENEQKVIAELGSPKEAAAELLENLLEKKLPESKKRKKSASWVHTIWIAFLAICAAPVGLSLIITAIVLLFAGVMIVFAMFVSVFALCLAGFLVSVKLLIYGVAAIPASIAGFCFISGLGILGLGVTLLLGVFLWQICIWAEQGLVHFVKWILKRGKNYE